MANTFLAKLFREGNGWFMKLMSEIQSGVFCSAKLFFGRAQAKKLPQPNKILTGANGENRVLRFLCYLLFNFSHSMFMPAAPRRGKRGHSSATATTRSPRARASSQSHALGKITDQ